MKSELNQNPQDNVKKLGELIKDIKVAMLTTTDPDGALRSRPMMTQQAEFNGDLWFFTEEKSGKAVSIRSDQHVNVSFAKPESDRYVSVTGRADIVQDREKIRQLWNPAYKAWFPKGVDDPNLALLKVNVESAEYWDSPGGALVHLVGFAKAMLTGQKYQPGDNERVDIRH